MMCSMSCVVRSVGVDYGTGSVDAIELLSRMLYVLTTLYSVYRYYVRIAAAAQ